MRIACAVVGVGITLGGGMTATAAAYNPIVPKEANRTITLDGKHMTIDDVVAIARYGAKVQLAPAARKRSNDAYELLLQGATQGLPIYWFNRAPGSGREDVIFEGDPSLPRTRSCCSSGSSPRSSAAPARASARRSRTRRSSGP